MYRELAVLIASFYLAIPDPIIRPPEQVRPTAEFSNPKTAAEWYEWALEEIQEGKREDARKSLETSLSLDPLFTAAKIQLAFLDLWEGKLETSYQLFLEVLTLTPCEPKSLEGLREIGARWNQREAKQAEVVEIYAILNDCEPNNPDTLFYLGRALARTKQWEEGELRLKECLALAPQYGDAAIQLGYIYLWEGRYDDAEAQFVQYPNNHDAKIGLALAARRQGKSSESKRHLEEILAQNPNHRQAREEKGRVLSSEMDYFAAENEFQWLIDDDPSESNYWGELFDIKSHTRYALFLETFYTNAKENDPSLGVPVVKDYYFLNAIHLLVPVTNRWRLDFKEIYYHQRENDIYPPVGVNYSAYLSGAQVTSSYFFAPNWRWDVSARGFQAWGSQNVKYPFHKTGRFEPGTGILYNSERQLFSLDAHRESFIIKNFARGTSYLLATDYLTGGYAYRFDILLKPELEAWITHIFIQDSLNNWENTEKAIARCGVPFVSDYITAIYWFEHGHFDQLSPNYYSFKQQFRNVIGGRLHVPISETVFWDTFFFHRWQTTYNLFQPINDTVFISPKQYLAGNWVNSVLTARYRDNMRLVLEGHYFRDTLIYRDWNVTGSFLWQF